MTVLLIASASAHATDEIQVYNANIAAPGQLTIQQHLNYVAIGQKIPSFPRGIASNGSLNGTPELAYGITDWWEAGLYLPFSIQDRQFLSDAFKVRSLFVSPNAAERSLFYGINFEFSYQTPRFSLSRYTAEIRPILGVRSGAYEFIVNPIVGLEFGRGGATTFLPAARIARKVQDDLYLGVEYYSDLGRIGSFDKLSAQQHTLFAVTDFKVGDFGINLGVGRGLSHASDRLVIKTIIGYAFAPAGAGRETVVTAPLNPLSRAARRAATEP